MKRFVGLSHHCYILYLFLHVNITGKAWRLVPVVYYVSDNSTYFVVMFVGSKSNRLLVIGHILVAGMGILLCYAVRGAEQVVVVCR